MNDDEKKKGITPWEKAIKEQLDKHEDPIEVQQRMIKILLELIPSPAMGKPRAIDKHDEGKRVGFLTAIFGDAVRVKILEALLQYPKDWFNLGDLAKVAGVGKASVKRIVDELLVSRLQLVEESQGEGSERLVKVSESRLVQELLFFYTKLRGMI
ncbi:MAG: hypothetical protein ACFFCS_09135 [Candidatus Hodarchaeota archaeon]